MVQKSGVKTHLGCRKPCKSWDMIYYLSTGAVKSSINRRTKKIDYLFCHLKQHTKVNAFGGSRELAFFPRKVWEMRFFFSIYVVTNL